MIYGFFHPGSGIGNQLHRYVATRVLAKEKGYEFGMIGEFKGKDFMDLDVGAVHNISYTIEHPAGKIVSDAKIGLWEEKTNYYNPEFNFIEDNQHIDGEFQDSRYFENHLNEVNEWLEVKPIKIPDDTCVIGFRGGEFYVFPDLGLPLSYFKEGIEIMRSKGVTKFEVHTDDPDLARRFLPDYPIISNAGINWRSMRCAKYAIISNSSFYILPRLLRHDNGTFDPETEMDVKHLTIAPRYWARRNVGQWSMPQNYYSQFKYI